MAEESRQTQGSTQGQPHGGQRRQRRGGMGGHMGAGRHMMGMQPPRGPEAPMGPMGPMGGPFVGPMGYGPRYGPPPVMGPRPFMPPKRMSDEQIKQEIETLFSGNPQLGLTEVQVQVESGIVTLSGQVSSAMVKRQAEAMVYPMPGVRDVANNLTIAGR